MSVAGAGSNTFCVRRRHAARGRRPEKIVVMEAKRAMMHPPQAGMAAATGRQRGNRAFINALPSGRLQLAQEVGGARCAWAASLKDRALVIARTGWRQRILDVGRVPSSLPGSSVELKSLRTEEARH